MLYFVYCVQTIILYYVLFHTCIYVFIAPLYVDRSWFSTYSKRACTHVHVSNMLQKILCWSLARVTTRTNRSHCGRQPLLHKLLAAGSVCVCVCVLICRPAVPRNARFLDPVVLKSVQQFICIVCKVVSMSIQVQYKCNSDEFQAWCILSIIHYPKSTLINVLVFHHRFLHKDLHDPSYLDYPQNHPEWSLLVNDFWVFSK